MIYSHNVSLAEWASVYEAYYTNALRACHGKPTVVVQHADLVADPYKAVTAAGVAGLALPEEAKVARLLRPATGDKAKKTLYLASERQVVGAAAQKISDMLSS